MIQAKNELTEAGRNAYMSAKELNVKHRLIDLLKDDGRGHHHAKYAALLKEFDISIVPTQADANFVAAIDVEHGVILVGEALLTKEYLFYQLNVLLRHELAHYLLMHEIRMMQYIGKDIYSEHIKYSTTWHNLLNIVMDFEISNKKYTEEDKQLIRHLQVNGKTISGLVTEDQRADWANLSLEEMYRKLGDETIAIKNKLEDELKKNNMYADFDQDESSQDYIDANIERSFIYRDLASPSGINIPLATLIKTLPNVVSNPIARNIISVLYTTIWQDPKREYSGQAVKKYMTQIAQSDLFKSIELTSPGGQQIIELFTPEEKLIAVDTLKNIYDYNFDKDKWEAWLLRKAKATNLTHDELTELLKEIEAEA